MNDTIVALASPQGIGALAIIRISGPDAISIVKKRLVEKDRFDGTPSHKVKLYRFNDSNTEEVIDEITAIKYSTPRSYTGENMVEIICHGGTVVVERILESLVEGGARYAGKGEFTRRAFCNGKTNLAKAESINQIVFSRSVIQQKSAIQSYFGKYHILINRWRENIKDILTDIESEIEFGQDDDILERDSNKSIKKKIIGLKKSIIDELNKRKVIKEIERGIFIAIVGPTNAGKSSLLNLILGYERSIVDPKGGTTRDYISENVKIGDVQVKFIDTAGLRKSTQSVEKKGVERSKEFIKSSKIVIWVTAADETIKPEEKEIKGSEGQKILGVINKIDLDEGIEKKKMFQMDSIPFIKISATNSKERGKVERFIVNEIQELSQKIHYDCIISNKRQEGIIEAIYKELEECDKISPGGEEILAEHCRNILQKLEEFVGKITTEDVLDKIFDEFCIGK